MAYFFWISFGLFLMILIITFYHRIQSRKNLEQQNQDSKVIELTDESFEETIKSGVTLVDFWAPWCAPCRMQIPIILGIATEFSDRAKICKINVAEHKKAAISMKIKNIPNIIIFKDGKAVRQIIGSKPKHLIVNALKTELGEKK